MRFNRLIAPAVLALSLVACSKEDDPTGPSDVEERIEAAENLDALSAKITDPTAKAAVEAAGVALDFGAPITTVSLTTGTASVSRNAVINARVAADIGGGAEDWSATGLQIVVQNSATSAANGTYNVLVMWKGVTDLVFVGMPSATSAADITTSAGGAFGGLFTNPNAAWQATAGSASISATASENACAGFANITGITCTQASFTGGFNISASTPFTGGGTNTATGSKTATLTSRTLPGFKVTVNCAIHSC